MGVISNLSLRSNQLIFRIKVRLLRNPLVKNIVLPVYRIPPWVRAYGTTKGLRYISMVVSAYLTRKNVIEINPPRMGQPVRIRIGKTDFDTFTEIFVKGEYEFTPDFKPRFIVDAGANIGYAAILFADRFPEAQIISIEPEESNYEALVANTSFYPNITCIRAAVWSRKASLRITNPDKNMSSYSRVAEVEPGRKGPIQSLVISDLLKRTNSGKIDILKIDVEGAEKEIFSENHDKWLGKVHVLMIETHDHIRDGCAETVCSAMAKYKFKKILQNGDMVIFSRSKT